MLLDVFSLSKKKQTKLKQPNPEWGLPQNNIRKFKDLIKFHRHKWPLTIDLTCIIRYMLFHYSPYAHCVELFIELTCSIELIRDSNSECPWICLQGRGWDSLVQRGRNSQLLIKPARWNSVQSTTAPCTRLSVFIYRKMAQNGTIENGLSQGDVFPFPQPMKVPEVKHTQVSCFIFSFLF